jgi:hypothetical protein
MIIELIEDENSDLILPLSDELCAEAGWNIGDTIEWIDNSDGSWTMRKKEMEKELVLVECISTFRMRYVVEVPKGKKEWAMDTVTMNEAEEFSQEHIGEQILSHRVIDNAEYLRLFAEDNAYLNSWDEDTKFRFVKRWEEQQNDIEHSKYYYDTERNK